MTTNTSAPPIWASEPERRAARAAGWGWADLAWERLSERGCAALAAGRPREAARALALTRWLSLLFRRGDPRRATALANFAVAARLRGRERAFRRRLAAARALWTRVPDGVEGLAFAPRARSSLFHLRMEARHAATFRANRLRRLRALVAETDAALAALAAGAAPPCRLASRWRGEKPAAYDDARKLLSACLLLAAEPEPSVASPRAFGARPARGRPLP